MKKDDGANQNEEEEENSPAYLPHLSSYLPYLPEDPKDAEKIEKTSHSHYLPEHPKEAEKAVQKEGQNEDTNYLPHLGCYSSYLPEDPKEGEKAAQGHCSHCFPEEQLNDENGSQPLNPRPETPPRDPEAGRTQNERFPSGSAHGRPEDEFGIPPPLPTTNLRRGANVPHQSRAGAFLASGQGNALVPAGTMNDDISDELSIPSVSNHQSNTAVHDDESGLARAHLVSNEEEEHRVMAVEHDAEAVAKKRKLFLRKLSLGLVTVLLALVCGVALPVILLGKQGQKEGTSNNSFDVQNQTKATIAPISLVVSGLPMYTIAALGDADSPQSQAYDWLLNDPNLDTLSEARRLQRFALATFYFATGGGRHKWALSFKWLEYDEHECDWFNTAKAPPLSLEKCNSTEDGSQEPHIQALALGLNGLVGTIPRQLALLTGLRGLVLHGNKLAGSIPKEVVGLPRLEGLVVAYNQFSETSLEYLFGAVTESLWYLDLAGGFTGTIPTKLDHLTNLSHLDLYETKAEGTIPSEVGLLSQLSYLDLRYSEFITGHIPTQLGRLTLLEKLSVGRSLTGTFPTQLGALTSLTTLHVGAITSSYTGYLPSEIGMLSRLGYLANCGNKLFNTTNGFPSYMFELTSLRCLILNNNSLSGTLPVELGQMTALTKLDLGYNYRLSGSIPTTWGQLTSLKELNLYINSLTGQIPQQLFNATKLEHLHLSGNKLSGEIPVELGQMTALTFLFLAFNQLSGSIPTFLGQMTALKAFNLYHNALTGQIPVELSQMPLDFFHLGVNLFDGTIPNELFFNWTKMRVFGVDRNHFSGSLPTEIGLMTDTTDLSTWGNQFSGTLPSEIGQMSLLGTLWSSNNALTGSVPTEVWKLPHIKDIGLERNQLSGTIWPDIGSGLPGLQGLEILRLSGNQLQGLVPSSLGLLESLTILALQENLLNGTVPYTLGSLGNLEGLYIDGNHLTGTVPSSLGLLTKLVHFTAGNQPLEGTLPAQVWQLPLLEDISIGNSSISGEIPSSGLSSRLNQLWIQDTYLTGVLPDLLCFTDIRFNCSESLCGCTCPC